MTASATLLLIKHRQGQHIDVPAGWGVYDNSENPDYQLCEVGAFLNCFSNASGRFRWPFDTSHAGLLSPKFFVKTRMTPDRVTSLLKRELAANDAVIFNPYPLAVANAYNIWKRGERKHPGLLQLAGIAGLDREQLLSWHHGTRFTAYCNYIIANRKFWERYLAYIKPLAVCLADAYRQGKIPDKYYHHARPLSDIPYFLERCLADFLLLNEAGIRIRKINRGKKFHITQYLVEPYDAMLRLVAG